MTRLSELIYDLEQTALHPRRSVYRAMEETGKDALGCFPIYTPEEMVYAAGLLPVGMWGGKVEIRLADKYLQGFCCSIMRANIEYGMQGTYDFLKAVIIPTFCDTLKCVCENWKVAVSKVPLIAMVYPQNRLLPAGFQYLTAELQRVKEQIEAVCGVKITDEALESSYTLYEEYRAAMRHFTEIAADYPITINPKVRHLIIKAGYFMDKKKYTEVITEITSALQNMKPEAYRGHRIVMTGLIGEPNALLEILQEAEIAVVADDFAQESRQYRTPGRAEGTAVEKMAYRIVDQRGCTFLYEEQKSKGEMIAGMVKRTNADGVILCMMKFCDPEEFDYPILKEALEGAGIPLLYIEIDQQMDSYEQIRTRIQSFAEMIK